MRLSRLLAWVVALVACPVLLSWAVAGDGETCQRQMGDEEIAACTRVIQDGGTSAKNRAIAYYNRGIAYKAKGDLDRAIADYSEALRLDPKDAFAYTNRGSAYYAKGDLERAL